MYFMSPISDSYFPSFPNKWHWVGKPKPFSSFYYSHRTYHFWYYWSPNVWLFSDTKQLWETSSVAHHLTQLWCYLPRESVRPRRWRAQSHNAPPAPLQRPITSPGYHLCFWLMAINLGFPWPLPKVWLICLSGSQTSGKHILPIY